MSYSSTTERNIALKKLLGKAQTSNDKGVSNESLPTGITMTYETIFGQAIPTTSLSASLWSITGGTVEKVRLSASFIAGTDTSDGRHGFQLSLPSTYQILSSNSKKGTAPFVNGQVIQSSNSGIQLIPTSFASGYEAVLYYGSTDSLTQIPVLDSRDWSLDYFNGVLFQQDPPGTGDHAQNPTIVDAYIYIGDYLDSVVTGSGGGGAVSSVANGSDNRVATFSAAATLNGEANLTFDGSVLNISGGIIHKRTAVTSHYTASSSDFILGVSASSGLQILMPKASNLTSGQTFTIKDEGGNSNSFNITINMSGSDTVDGATNITIESPYAAVNLYTNGTDKFFIY